MAQDEARFGRMSTPKRAWAPPGVRPKAPRQMVRELCYVYAVVAPEQGKMTSLILPTADAAMMNLFLEQVAHDFAEYFLVIQVDQAGWHRTKELPIPETIRLIFQPASSPEVNPVEHLWEEVREKYLHHRAFSSLQDLQEVLCQALSDLSQQPEPLRSMMFFPHFRVEYSNATWYKTGEEQHEGWGFKGRWFKGTVLWSNYNARTLCSYLPFPHSKHRGTPL